MFKRVVINIMQQIAPAFIVVCVLLCLSFNFTFPLHRDRSKNLAGLLNGSQHCGSASAKKIIRTAKQAIEFKDSSDTVPHYQSAEKRKLGAEDLHQYEQLVLMKKYPYLDFKEFEPKYRPSVKNVKYAREADLAEGNNCQLTDNGPHVEIFSRGVSGFAIPRPSIPAVVDMKLNIQSAKRADKSDVKLSEYSRILNNLKDFVRNYVEVMT